MTKDQWERIVLDVYEDPQGKALLEQMIKEARLLEQNPNPYEIGKKKTALEVASILLESGFNINNALLGDRNGRPKHTSDTPNKPKYTTGDTIYVSATSSTTK